MEQKKQMKINLTEIPAYYINLPQHTEKNEKISGMLKDLGFKAIKRLDGTIYPENPIAGCSRAHYNALSHLQAPFILFEDDAFLNEPEEFRSIVEIPEDADALYLGVSTWGRMNGHNGQFIQYDLLADYPGILRVYNMLATHSILYLTQEYVSMIKRVAYHTGYVIENYNDVGFAEVQRYFNVYSVDRPIFSQSSNMNATNIPVTSTHHEECMCINHLQFYPYPLK